MSGINWNTFIKNIEPEFKIFGSNNTKQPTYYNEMEIMGAKDQNVNNTKYVGENKKNTNALIKLDKVNSTINSFITDFLSNSDITNNKEYLDLWNNYETQDKLCLYIKQKKLKMKETIDERNAKKLEKNLKREGKLKAIHQKRMDKQENKPKTAFYYFKQDETIKLKLEHPTWNRKEVHSELQKKWKLIKTNEESRPYREKTKIE